MDSQQISRTALTAAAARAAHLVVDREPYLFRDPLARTLLGEHADELIDYHRRNGDHPVLAGARATVTCRSSFAEAQLQQAVRAGVRQYVLLAAGLDSSAHRAGPGVRTFEVDHPAMQRWKLDRLARAAVPVPATVTHVPLDFETGDLDAALAEHGFRPDRPAVVSWLGTTMYLTRSALQSTLTRIGGWSAGTVLVLDYLLPASLRDQAGQEYAERVAAFSAEQGEPWLTTLAPGQLTGLLREAGFGEVRQVSQRDSVEPACWRRTDRLTPLELFRLAVGRVPAA